VVKASPIFEVYQRALKGGVVENRKRKEQRKNKEELEEAWKREREIKKSLFLSRSIYSSTYGSDPIDP
jgi:hypothetical protein